MTTRPIHHPTRAACCMVSSSLLAAAFAGTAPAYADLGDQLAKLLPDDGAARSASSTC